MLDQKLRIISEGLARAVDRRKFIKGASAAMFSTFAAVAAGHASLGKAAAAGAAGRGPAHNPPQCAPPGPYCNLNGVNEPNGCRNAQCYQHLDAGVVKSCRVYYQWYQAGCWTTAVQGGYWVCCDCECFNAQGGGRRSCGCAHFNGGPNQPPIPLPDGQN